MKHSPKAQAPGIITRTVFCRANNLFSIGIFVFSCALFTYAFKGWSAENNDSNEQLLRQYVQSKGAGIISFDASNIKQFWIDNSVISKDGLFKVLLNRTAAQGTESIPLKIQLANVNEVMDCKVEVISEEKDYSFSILNSKSKVLSNSSSEENFLHYNVISSVFHLENAADLAFHLKFSSKTADSISIKRIILSFSINKDSSFLLSPGVLKIAENDVIGGTNKKSYEDNDSFSVSGKWFGLVSKKKILLSGSPVTNAVKIKNIGEKPTNIYFGYAPYTANRQNIQNQNNPYKNNNQVLKVISSETNSNKIIVDTYPDWEKGCYLVLNAKEDLSDFPNFEFIDGTIVEVKKIDDNQTEIILDKPIRTAIRKDTKIRIQSKPGNTYLYTNSKRLNPGEEATFSSTMSKDESFLQYSTKAFCRGTYYVVPVILSYSVDPQEENTILVSDFTVSY